MKFGQTTQFEITEVDKKGRGCGQINGRTACAYFAFPGETVVGRMTGRRQGALKMEVEELVSASPRRVEAPCPQAGVCGGCKWQQIDYDFQLELKRRLVEAALAPVGLGGRIEAVVPSPELFHFRNRMDYCVGPDGQVGLKEPGYWNRHIDLETCLLMSEEAPQVIDIFRRWMKDNSVEPWDNRRFTGFLRYLVIREGRQTGQRLVTVVTAGGEMPAADRLVEALAPLATTVYRGVNPTQTDVSVCDDMRLLRGPANLEEEVNGRRFLIPPNSFFQTNTTMAGRLVETVGEFLAAEGWRPRTLLDLYCGVGFFGISLAERAERVIGVELDEAAVAVATENARRNGVANASFSAAAAESLIWQDQAPDTVIVDPPRSGLHPKVVKTLLERRPERIIYVSCNYGSLARDWLALQTAYGCPELRCLDLFPHGPHVETVALLKRTS